MEITQIQASIEKLVLKLNSFVCLLEQHRYDYVIHKSICQFYYMQVTEEIRLLESKVAEGEMSLEPVLRAKITNAYLQWRKDYCWLHRYLGKPRI